VFAISARVSSLDHNGAMPIEMGAAEFDALVDRALDEIPDEIATLVRNVVVLVEDEPPEDEPDLLGLYDGIALTERWGDPMMELPDRIFVFRGPLLDMCDTVEQLEDEVRITVVHEVAHHFGIDDDRLHELGYA
jgi:predicted Zn-dependent protease with MMP-like domain